MKCVITLSFLLFSFPILSQDNFIISLENLKISDFSSRNFYFDKIFENNEIKIIGYSKLDRISKVKILSFKNGVRNEINDLLARSFPEKEGQLGLQLVIEELSSFEEARYSKDVVTIIFHAQISIADTILYSNKLQTEYEGDFSDENYAELIVKTIKEFIYDFALVPDQQIIKEDNKSMDIEDLVETGSRNVVAVGYQIGGYTLIGFNYEIRVSDNIGVHFGAGYRGYTAGVKVHWKPTKDGGFINISYKDGGFGLINGWAVEYGSRKAFGQNKGTFGFHYQVGLALITNLSLEYRKAFGGVEPPFPTISLGLGFSW